MNTQAPALADDISICLGGATAPSAVAVEMVHCTVVDESEKAVRVKGDSGPACWFPKSALVSGSVEGCYKLARWFRPGDYAARWLDRNARISGLSNA